MTRPFRPSRRSLRRPPPLPSEHSDRPARRPDGPRRRRAFRDPEALDPADPFHLGRGGPDLHRSLGAAVGRRLSAGDVRPAAGRRALPAGNPRRRDRAAGPGLCGRGGRLTGSIIAANWRATTRRSGRRNAAVRADGRRAAAASAERACQGGYWVALLRHGEELVGLKVRPRVVAQRRGLTRGLKCSRFVLADATIPYYDS